MPISPTIRKPLLVGASAGLLHFFLCVAVFASVQFSADGQAGFAWFPFFVLDYPTGPIAYELFGNLAPMTALIDWWYSIGNNQGPNIRALILFGIFGSLQWFCVVTLITYAIQDLVLLRRRSKSRGMKN